MSTVHRRAGLAGPFAAVYPAAQAPAPRTMWQILEATAAAFPRAAAIDDGRTVLRYRGLLREARRIGDRLAAAGIGAGDRVGIRIPSGTAELYLSILAVLSIGAAEHARRRGRPGRPCRTGVDRGGRLRRRRRRR